MTTRDSRVADFCASVRDAFRAAKPNAEVRDAVDRIWDALATPGAPESVDDRPADAPRPPVCRKLDDAFAVARAGTPELAAVADALAALDPELRWQRRPRGGPFASENWPDGHANAEIVGPHGLERRADVALGASLLAPHVRYPDHQHPPEEAYLVLTPGRFQHDGSDWFEPGPGGTLHNRAGVRHAMASDATPLLAVWCHWLDGPVDAGSTATGHQ